MSLFILYCVDRENALEVRLAAREAHLAYIGSRAAEVQIGGPMLDDEGRMAGSMLVIDVADRAAAEAFSAADPYTKAGLWQRVEIRPIKLSVGQR